MRAGHAAFRVFAILALPFAVLVRGSVSLYRDLGFPTWLALGVAAGIALGIVTMYAAWIARQVSGKPRVGTMLRWVALPVVVSYCGYALIFLGRDNAKTEAIRSTYWSAHPLIRVALSTVILADGDLVVTDLSRTPDDYRRMGLSVNEASLHFPQRDGWVHAVDIRTAGRNPVMNAMLWTYFRFMGFETLRHHGTADHLHIALPVDRP